jgi:hypothetical protein
VAGRQLFVAELFLVFLSKEDHFHIDFNTRSAGDFIVDCLNVSGTS